MKKIYLLFLWAPLVLLLLQLTACQKFIDRYLHGHDGHSNATCKITQIKQNVGSTAVRTGTFYYSSGNRLDSIIFDLPTGSAGAQFHYFDYDSHNKLIGYRNYYDRDPADYYFLHKYVYSDAGMIVRDTVWVREAGTAELVVTFDYDSHNRVSKEWTKAIELDGVPADEQPTSTDYVYDGNGNLQPFDEAVTYDDKPGFLTTSKVLQFTEKNYSRNNPMGATSYNESGLPLGFSNAAKGGVLQMDLPTWISYDCQ